MSSSTLGAKQAMHIGFGKKGKSGILLRTPDRTEGWMSGEGYHRDVEGAGAGGVAEIAVPATHGHEL